MTKVLLVDADWDNLVVLQQALVAARYEVAVALSGSFALTMLERERPDVIVSLTEIQDMDAYELCSIIRSDPLTHDIPFLLLAGAAGPVPGAAARAGVSRVIAGKFGLPTLVIQVGELLRRARRTEPLPSGSVDGEAAPRAASELHSHVWRDL